MLIPANDYSGNSRGVGAAVHELQTTHLCHLVNQNEKNYRKNLTALILNEKDDRKISPRWQKKTGGQMIEERGATSTSFPSGADSVARQMPESGATHGNIEKI